MVSNHSSRYSLWRQLNERSQGDIAGRYPDPVADTSVEVEVSLEVLG